MYGTAVTMNAHNISLNPQHTANNSPPPIKIKLLGVLRPVNQYGYEKNKITNKNKNKIKIKTETKKQTKQPPPPPPHTYVFS